MGADPDALVSNGKSPVGRGVRQNKCRCSVGDRRKSTIDGPRKSADQNGSSPNGRPLVIRAQSIHSARPRLLIRPEERSPRIRCRSAAGAGLGDTVEGEGGPGNKCAVNTK